MDEKYLQDDWPDEMIIDRRRVPGQIEPLVWNRRSSLHNPFMLQSRNAFS